MERPEVRIIQDQQEEIKPANISKNEEDMLLSKYGYKPNTQNIESPSRDNELSFEEMIKQEELKNQQRIYNQIIKSKETKPYTFGGNYNSETIYGTDNDSGFTFKVNIVSDMPIPKNR
jgi:hypothetical protein